MTLFLYCDTALIVLPTTYGEVLVAERPDEPVLTASSFKIRILAFFVTPRS